MGSFTGNPSRGGFFGIRKLNVSWGLGPQGQTVTSARGAISGKSFKRKIPGAESKSEEPGAVGTELLPGMVLTPFGFMTHGDMLKMLAEISPEHPLGTLNDVRMGVAALPVCEPPVKAPRSLVRASVPGASIKLETEVAVSKAPTSRTASQIKGIGASSTSRTPSAKGSSSGPSTRKKR